MASLGSDMIEALRFALAGQGMGQFLHHIGPSMQDETASCEDLRKLITVVLICLHYDISRAEQLLQGRSWSDGNPTPVYRAPDRQSLYGTTVLG
jgi:hypothetical protein